MFSLRFTIVLFVVLLVPFTVRLLGKETFPAVLLPGHPSVLRRSDSLTARQTVLYARRAGIWRSVDENRFFYPLSPEYVATILSDRLGLDSTSRGGRLRLWSFDAIGTRTRRLDEAGRRELMQWIRAKLAAQHFDTSQIRMLTFDETIGLRNGGKKRDRIVEDRMFSLD